MERSTQLLLFGDQTTSIETGLRQLLRIKGNVVLTAFLEQVHFALRKEISNLSVSERVHFPRSTSVIELLTKYNEKRNAALDSTLTCIYQLGCFINCYSSPGRDYPSTDDSHVAGLCTGLLAAAAVSVSRTIEDLLSAAVEAVVIALRVGLCVSRAKGFADATARSQDSWSVVLMKIRSEDASVILARFCREQILSPSSQPYISAVSPQSITVSGPPRVLDDFLRFPQVADLKTAKVPIHAPYHASHFYSNSDVDAILKQSSSPILDETVSNLSIFSSTTGQTLPQGLSYRELLRLLLGEILLQPLNWDKVIEGVSSFLSDSSITRFRVVPVAAPVAQGLTSILRQKNIAEITIDDEVNVALHGPCHSTRPGRHDKSKIAIVGLSGRFPEAADPEHFWDLLYKGLDVHKEVPADRFDVKAHYDETGHRKNTSKVRHGCWINEPGLFDPRFFNISPKEAAQADPGQRLALQTAYEAIEMAGIIPDRTPSTQRDRVGIFYGMTSDDWREVNSGQNVDTYFIPGGNRAFTPGRINYYFKFSGPSVSADTACSSSLAAIHLACNSLWRGDCDTAIAGGTNVMTNPDNFAGLDRGHFLSRTGNCNTFDDGADGYCRADGVGTVILKRLEDAHQDNDPVLGVILSAYTNHSAESVSITRPHVGAQQYIFNKLLNDAGVDPHDISYIEMHGTGTQAGDGVEMKSVLDVFAPDYTRKSDQPLHLGSAKANVGHGESASGVTALVKVLLMMQKNLIPPHCGIKTKINHTFPTDFMERNVHIAMEPISWNRSKNLPRRAFVNNFSAAGGNSALLLEDAPFLARSVSDDPRSVHMIAVSAKSATALQNNARNLGIYIEQHALTSDDSFLAKLSYTTTARRIHYPYRVMASGANLEEIQERLRASFAPQGVKPVPATPLTIGFVFTGQGAQYAGMGRHLFETFSQFRSDILSFDDMAQRQGFPSFVQLIAGSVSVETLQPIVIQLGTTCLQMALTRLWSSFGIKPNFVLGHSLGEYAALHAAEVLSASDTIYLCGSRARLLQERCEAGTHAMIAVKGSFSDLGPYLVNDKLEIACSNGPQETVLAGLRSDVDILYQRLSTAGFKSTKLNVPFAFHTAQVEPILESFKEVAVGVTFHAPTIPIISAVIGNMIEALDTSIIGPDYLMRHCRDTVNFMQGIHAAREAKLFNDKSMWIEIGPHSVCSGMVKSSLHAQVVTLSSLRRNDDGWKVLVSSLSSLYLAGHDINWGEYHRDFAAGHEVLQLPAYSWDNKNYWIQYEHNWTLTKGDPPTTVPEVAKVSSSFSTISVQKILEEREEGTSATVLMESDFQHPLLKAVASGHRVNGAQLCPSSLYADIAQTLGSYLLEKYHPEWKDYGIDVRDMNAQKPLIAKDEGVQLFRASMRADWTTRTAAMNLYSVNSAGKKITDHASCVVQFADVNIWAQEWQRNTYLIQRSIKSLHRGVDDGENHRIHSGMGYKLFASLVEYDRNYKGMQEIILDSEQYEATASVRFQAPATNFHRNPFWIDSLGQLTGFTVNANDATSKDFVYVNHGWKSMRCFKKFSAESQYRTYVKMQPIGDGVYAGDLYVLEEGVIIAVYEQVKFQCIPRRVLDTFLPPGVASSSSTTTQIRTVAAPKRLLSTAQKNSTTVLSTASGPGTTSDIVREVKSQVHTSIRERAMQIVSDEVGLAISELTDEVVFADYGVDSLLSLTILGRFREDLDVDAGSSLFTDCHTLRELKVFLSQYESELGSSSDPEGSARTSTDITTPAETNEDEYEDNTVAIIGNILSEEIGISVSELDGELSFAELGMDSLLSLTVLGRIREELELDLPAEFFSINLTLNDVREFLAPRRTPATIDVRSAIPTNVEKELIVSVKELSLHPPATSILLQGNPRTATKNLFLFPDGSGSATSYASIPLVSPDFCVYGLNCPYMRKPENLTCSLDELTTPYLTEIRRRQAKGPYNLGGWSAGGICAFDAAQHLYKTGEKVDRLILIDSPNPIGLAKLPPRLYTFFESIGFFGSNGAAPPTWLVRHFLAFIDSLDAYKPVPFAHMPSAPKTYMIWATDGVCKNPEDPRPEPHADDPREMTWLLENRKDFGPNGWDTLLGKDKLVIETMRDANHFSMMDGENAILMSDFLRRALL